MPFRFGWSVYCIEARRDRYVFGHMGDPNQDHKTQLPMRNLTMPSSMLGRSSG